MDLRKEPSIRDSEEEIKNASGSPDGGNANLKYSEDGVLLIPQPSDDPDDPLNWPNWRKHMALAALSFGSFVCYVTATIIAAGTPTIAKNLHVSKSQATYVLTGPVVVYACGTIILVAASHFLGRRPVLIFGTLVSMICCFGCAVSKSYSTVMVARFFQAFGAAGPLALGPASIKDMYFRHELGRMVGINTILLVISPFSGGIIGGPIIQNLGWRWTQWISAAIMGVALFGMILMVPETIYVREQTNPQKTTWGFRIPRREHQHTFWFVLSRPLAIFFYPAVTLPCFWFGIAYMVHVGITSNISLIFEAAPFHFTVIQAGLTFFSGLIGAFTGEVFAGPVIDYLTKRSIKLGRPWEPELRFRAIWPSLFMMPVGLIIFGTTLQFTKVWAAPLIGNGIYIFGVQIMTTVVQTYIMECYPEQAMEAALVLNFFRNILSFIPPFFLNKWIVRAGAALPFGIFAMLGFVTFFPLVLPLIFHGPAIRKWSGTPNWGKTT